MVGLPLSWSRRRRAARLDNHVRKAGGLWTFRMPRLRRGGTGIVGSLAGGMLGLSMACGAVQHVGAQGAKVNRVTVRPGSGSPEDQGRRVTQFGVEQH